MGNRFRVFDPTVHFDMKLKQVCVDGREPAHANRKVALGFIITAAVDDDGGSDGKAQQWSVAAAIAVQVGDGTRMATDLWRRVCLVQSGAYPFTPSNSTSKMSVAFGGITPAAPRAP
jgi:hypothetical protein